MIRIYKDNDQKYVTKGAYEDFYKPLGYKTIIDEKPTMTGLNQVVEHISTDLEDGVITTATFQLDNEVRVTKRTRGRSNKKNSEGDSNDISDKQ